MSDQNQYQQKPVNTSGKASSTAAVSASPTVTAAAGGGGRGMSIVRIKELVPVMRTAATQAAAAFKNDDIYVEKYVESPRHIEISAYRSSHRPSSALSTCRPRRRPIHLYGWAATVRPIHSLHHRGDEADERDFAEVSVPAGNICVENGQPVEYGQPLFGVGNS